MTQRDLKNALSGTGEELKKKKNDIVNTINPLAGTNRAREIPRYIVTSAAIANYDYNYRQMHRGTMKRDNMFPMAINYRINSGQGEGEDGARTRNCLFCEINFSALSQKRLLLDRIEIFFFAIAGGEGGWERGGDGGGRVASITLNDQFFSVGTRVRPHAHVRLSFASNLINLDESLDRTDYWSDIS